MTSDSLAKSPKHKVTFVRVAIVVVVLSIIAVLALGKKRDTLIDTCNTTTGDAQEILAACDTLLNWAAFEPATRSVIHLNKVQIMMAQEDWEAAKREADLAVEADPGSHIPWEWMARVLEAVGDTDGMVEAQLTAFNLQPDNPDALRGKYKLLVSLDRHAAVDEFVSERLRDDGEVHWLPTEPDLELILLLRNPSQYPLLQAVFRDFALDTRDQLAASPTDDKLRYEFFVYCRVAPSSCPPLYPERRNSYPKYICDQTIAVFDVKYPEFMENVEKSGRPKDLLKLLADEPVGATVLVQARYIAATVVFENEATAKNAEHLLLHDRMLYCVSGGEFALPERHQIKGFEPTDPREEAEIYYGPELRRNLVDLAYAIQNTAKTSP